MRQRSDLRPYQQRAVEFIKKNEACTLFLDVGLGKTAICETAYRDLYESFDSRRMLVIAPLRVARKVWRDEQTEWQHLSGMTVSCITGTPAARIAALKKGTDVHCINYENLEWLYAQFVQNKKQIRKWPWDLVVCDEAHRLKNPGSKRFKVVNSLRKLFPRIVHATGSLIPNGYYDLWALTYLQDRGKRLGYTQEAFAGRWFHMPQRDEHVRPTLKPGAKEEIEDLIADITLSMRAEDYMDLPPVLMNRVRIPLEDATFEIYRRFERDFIAEYGGATLKAANSGALNSKLLQLANGAVYFENKMWGEFHKAKIKALCELLEDLEGHRVMIAYYFKHDLERLEEVLKTYPAKRYRVCRTEQDEDDWNKGDIDWLLVHPDSVGEGTNLHKNDCEDLIWFGLTANLLSWQQTNGRLFGGGRRIGKCGKIHVLMAEGTIDDEYADLLDDKAADQEALSIRLANRAKKMASPLPGRPSVRPSGRDWKADIRKGLIKELD